MCLHLEKCKQGLNIIIPKKKNLLQAQPDYFFLLEEVYTD